MTTFGDLLIEAIFDDLKDLAIGFNEKRKLKEKVEEYINLNARLFISSDSLEEEIDSIGLSNYISYSLISDYKEMIKEEKNKKDKFYNSIIEKACLYSHALKNESKRKVKVIITGCIDVLNAFYISENDTKTIVILNKVQDGIDNSIAKQLKPVLEALLVIIDNIKEEPIREKLIHELDKAFKVEKDNNPSMTNFVLDDNIYPNTCIEKTEAFVHICNDENITESSDKIPLYNAIQKSWKMDEHYHISLFGIGGAGKTTSLLSIEWNIPIVFIPIRSITKINDYIKETLLKGDSELYKEFISLCENENKEYPNVIVVLDGFNETDNSNRREILREISSLFVNKPGIQLIISSRYDVSSQIYNDKFLRLHMEQLTELQIKEFLTTYKIKTPEKSSHIWKVIDTPLMLNIYTRIESLRETYGKIEEIQLKDSINTASLIWNYLQSEIYRCSISYAENIADLVISTEIIAPYIAYQMVQMKSSGIFSIPRDEMMNFIQIALNGFCEKKKQENIPLHIKDVFFNYPEYSKEASSYYKLLTESTCLFFVVDKCVQLMHQHFRDALAALYLYELAEITTDSIPKEWKEQQDQYVIEFLAEFLQTECSGEKNTWDKLWNICKQDYSDKKLSEEDVRFVELMLSLYKMIYGDDISKIDFSGLDLSNISLSGFILSSKSVEHFKNTVISEKTFLDEGHRMKICSISWSPSDDSFISASNDCSLLLWDVQNNIKKRINAINNPHKRYIRCAKWSSSDAKVMFSAGDDQEIIKWTFDGEKWNYTIMGECDGWIYDLIWDSNINSVICSDSKGDIYNFNDSKKFKYQHIHSKSVKYLADSGHSYFASASDDKLENFVVIWNKESKTPISKIWFLEPIKSLKWIEEGNILSVITSKECCFIDVLGLINDKVVEYGVTYDKYIKGRVDLDKHNYALISNNNIENYCTVIRDDIIEIYTCKMDSFGNYSLILLASISVEKNDLGIITYASWNNDNNTLILGSQNGSLWKLKLLVSEQTYERIYLKCISKGSSNSVRCSDWSPDGTLLASGYDDGNIRIWDVNNKKCIHIFHGHKDSVKCISWYTDNNKQILCSGSNDGNVIIWDYSNHETSPIIIPIKSPINSIKWTKSGNIVGCTDNNGLFVYDRSSSKELNMMSDISNKFYSVLVSDNDKYAISAGDDSNLYVWRLEKDIFETKLIQTIKSDHVEPIRGLAWDHDNKGIFSGSNDKRLSYNMFDSDTGVIDEESKSFPEKHTDFIYSVATSVEGRYVITGSTDFRVGFWNTKNNQLVAVGEDHTNFVWNVIDSPEINEEYFVASSSSDGTVRIWNISSIGETDAPHAVISLEVLPAVELIGADFRDAKIVNESLKALIGMNGGIV